MTTRSETDEFTDKKPSWWRRPGCLMLSASGLLILAAFFAFCIYVPPLRISEETTRITGPLTADGQIDFLKHLEETTYPPEMKTDDNGFRVFLRTFGDLSGPHNEFYRTQKYEKLGLDPNEKPTMTMPPEPDEVLKEYYRQKGEVAPVDFADAYRKPWTLEQLPMFETWLAEIDAPLDAVAEMVRKPVFFPPLLQNEKSAKSGKPQLLIEIILPDIQMFRSVARRYQARAYHRIAVGDVDGAIDDTITMLHLARRIAHGCLVQYLVGIAIEGVAHTIPIAGNPEHPPTKEQLLRLHETLAELPPFPPSKDAYEWERCSALSVMQAVANRESVQDFQEIGYFAVRSNTNLAYRQLNEAYDTLTGQLPRSELHRFESLPDARTMATNLPTTFGRGRLFGLAVAAYMLPAVNAFEEAIRRIECTLNMKRLTLALLMYKVEHGAFPGEDWIERIKPYLGEEPERYLRCPSCVSLGFGTNYALILHEKEPEDSDTLLLVELREPLPPEEAFFTPEEALPEFSGLRTPRPIGSQHPGMLNMSRRSGGVGSHMLTVTENDKELHRMLGLEMPEEEETE